MILKNSEFSGTLGRLHFFVHEVSPRIINVEDGDDVKKGEPSNNMPYIGKHQRIPYGYIAKNRRQFFRTYKKFSADTLCYILRN